MKFTLLAIAGSLASPVLAAPTQSHVVHEKRTVDASRWVKRYDLPLHRDAVIPMSFGLAQQNLENGYEYLMDVSHPESKNYGKHWSMDKIAETFAPSAETFDSVKSWLLGSGIENSRLATSKGRNWIRVNLTVDEAESLLQTKYYLFTNAKSGKDHLGCEEYSVPSHITQHLDFITPTIQLDAINKRQPIKKRDPAINPYPIVKPGPQVSGITYSLANCDQYITPDCLRALYSIPNGTLATSSYGIVEYSPEAYLQNDLNLFYSTLSRQIPKGTAPTLDSIDGGTEQTTTQSFNDNGEADLDLQYAIALVYPLKVTLYQAGDQVEGASFNNLLDAFDSSYCKGDDPDIDATYPDPDGGYQGKETCGSFTAAKVISTSYGYDEAGLPASYEVRQCNEYMKLGLAGTTFIYSSGDEGVAGGAGCCTNAKCAGGSFNDGDSGTFNPSFPATCPYITAVGATQIKPNTAVTAQNPEEACETVIYSGGGFSNLFAMPSYQKSAVSSYYANHKPSYSSTQYNNSQAVRGFPDVSANGANYQVAVDGSIQSVYGTSASAPVFGSIITLINEQRANAGKSAVGFINPTLYSNPSAFKDITSGNNPGCGTNGFTAVSGWDPVTGLGTPNYQSLLKVFMALQ